MPSIWSKDDDKILRKAFKTVQADHSGLSKSQKWQLIAGEVGNEKTKHDCYNRYKDLLEIRAKQKEGEVAAPGKRALTAVKEAEMPASSYHHEDDGNEEYVDDYEQEQEQEEEKKTEIDALSQPMHSSDMSAKVVDGGDVVKGIGSITLNDGDKGDKASFSTGPSRLPSSSHEAMTVDNCEDFDFDMDSPNSRATPKLAASSSPPTVAAPPAFGGPVIGESNSEMASKGYNHQDAALPNPCSSSSSLEPLEEKPITNEIASSLRLLLFGSPTSRFNNAWLQQEVTFSKYPDLGFGLIQHKGGPCGVIAVTQAYLLAHLIHGAGQASQRTSTSCIDWKKPTASQRRDSLAWAISTIIWRAGRENSQSVVALTKPAGVNLSARGIKSDGVIENVWLYSFDNELAVHQFIKSNLDTFTNKQCSGIVLLTYSVMLSRGLEQVKADADDAFGGRNTLIDRHGYATQELVNLLLIGRAHSNVFDGEKWLDDDTGKTEDVVRLRGIPSRGLIGFLTLFEAYETVQVGKNLKEPVFPIWVVCSESHYSVLFASEPLNVHQAPPCFDLWYYDELANQQEVIILGLNQKPKKAPPLKPDDAALIPPLDLVIRTKWPGTEVTWNIDPIL